MHIYSHRLFGDIIIICFGKSTVFMICTVKYTDLVSVSLLLVSCGIVRLCGVLIFNLSNSFQTKPFLMLKTGLDASGAPFTGNDRFEGRIHMLTKYSPYFIHHLRCIWVTVLGLNTQPPQEQRHQIQRTQCFSVDLS